MGNASVTALALGRIVVGLASWFAPDTAGKLLGINPRRNKQAPFLARLFGVRDVVLGLGTLMAAGPARRTWLQLGILADAADAAAAGLAHRDGYFDAETAAKAAAPAIGAVVLGAAGLAGGQDAQDDPAAL